MKHYRTWTTIMATVEADSFEEAEKKSLESITCDGSINVEMVSVDAMDEL